MSLKKQGNQNNSHSQRVSIVSNVNYLDPTKLDITPKEWYELLLNSDLSFLTQQQFKILMNIERILTPLARELQYRHGFVHFTREELEDTMKTCFKDLYLQFRDTKITYDQLQARMAERKGIASYKVFDDIKCLLNPAQLERLERMKARKQAYVARRRKIIPEL